MKKYRLIKELPGIPQWSMYEQDEYGSLTAPIEYRAQRCWFFEPDVYFEPWFSEWFEEVKE